MPRPLTHDLMKDMLGALEIKVEQDLITELRARRTTPSCTCGAGEERTVVSSRPSDAVAVAVRTETPIFVADELMESEGIILAIEPEEEEDEVPEEMVGSSAIPRVGAPRGLRSVTQQRWALALVASAAVTLAHVQQQSEHAEARHDDDRAAAT